MTELSRRGFLAGALAGGGLLSLGVTFSGCGDARGTRIHHAEQTGELAANMYVTVKPDGRIALQVNKAEIGQGVATCFATLAAEELEVPVDAVDVAYADSLPEYRTSTMLHQTGGSTSTKEAYRPVREAAAAAREMLIAAAAATWKVSASECEAAEGRVHHQASGRDLGYGELTVSAARVEVPKHPRIKRAGEFAKIGKVDLRVDARAKVDGSAVFGIDVHVDGMVHARVIHGPQFRARATAIRADAARAMPGVIDVFAIPTGVAVVADKYWQAIAASRAVEVDWGPGKSAGLDSEAMAAAMRATAPGGASAHDQGNAHKAIAHAATVVEAVYEAPFLAHATMEPQNATVHVRGDHVEVWAPVQAPTLVQEFVAEAVGVDKDDVLVHTTLCGGGFGRRAIADFVAECAVIARHVGKPVKTIWSRESDLTQGYYRPQAAVTMRGGLDGHGRVVGLDAHVVSPSIVASFGEGVRAVMPGLLPRGLERALSRSLLAMFSSSSIADPLATEGLGDQGYAIDNLRVRYTPVQIGIPVSPWRSVGHSIHGFVTESFVDELAHAAKQDPLAFRLAMLGTTSRQRRVLEAVAKLAGWGSAPAKGIGRGLARHESFDSEVAEIADVEIVDGRIRVRKVWCAVECGVAVNPSIVRAQMEGAILFGLSAALDQQITVVDGQVQETNYDTYPVIRMFEAPEIEVVIVDSDEDPSGVGEPGLPPLAPAVANAIFALTGKRLRRMPLQPALDGGAS